MTTSKCITPSNLTSIAFNGTLPQIYNMLGNDAPPPGWSYTYCLSGLEHIQEGRDNSQICTVSHGDDQYIPYIQCSTNELTFYKLGEPNTHTYMVKTGGVLYPQDIGFLQQVPISPPVVIPVVPPVIFYYDSLPTRYNQMYDGATNRFIITDTTPNITPTSLASGSFSANIEMWYTATTTNPSEVNDTGVIVGFTANQSEIRADNTILSTVIGITTQELSDIMFSPTSESTPDMLSNHNIYKQNDGALVPSKKPENYLPDNSVRTPPTNLITSSPTTVTTPTVDNMLLSDMTSIDSPMTIFTDPLAESKTLMSSSTNNLAMFDGYGLNTEQISSSMASLNTDLSEHISGKMSNIRTDLPIMQAAAKIDHTVALVDGTPSPPPCGGILQAAFATITKGPTLIATRTSEISNHLGNLINNPVNPNPPRLIKILYMNGDGISLVLEATDELVSGNTVGALSLFLPDDLIQLNYSPDTNPPLSGNYHIDRSEIQYKDGAMYPILVIYIKETFPVILSVSQFIAGNGTVANITASTATLAATVPQPATIANPDYPLDSNGDPIPNSVDADNNPIPTTIPNPEFVEFQNSSLGTALSDTITAVSNSVGELTDSMASLISTEASALSAGMSRVVNFSFLSSLGTPSSPCVADIHAAIVDTSKVDISKIQLMNVVHGISPSLTPLNQMITKSTNAEDAGPEPILYKTVVPPATDIPQSDRDTVLSTLRIKSQLVDSTTADYTAAMKRYQGWRDSIGYDDLLTQTGGARGVVPDASTASPEIKAAYVAAYTQAQAQRAFYVTPAFTLAKNARVDYKTYAIKYSQYVDGDPTTVDDWTSY